MLHLLTAELQLGRMNTAMLTDQQRMELLFSPSAADDGSLFDIGDADDACTWVKVTCDQDGSVIDIDWHFSDLTIDGSICFTVFPPHLQMFNVYHQPLTGEVDVSSLPEFLEYFCLEKCFFTGTLDLGSLPRGLEAFLCLQNKIVGIINIENLPEGMQEIAIEEPNIKEKVIRVGKVPKRRCRIDLTGCGFADVELACPEDRGRIAIGE